MDDAVKPAKTSTPTPGAPSPSLAKRKPAGALGRGQRFGLTVLVLVLGFSVPFYDLIRFAAGSQLYSYILLIPFISIYLVWWKRRSLPHSSQPVRYAPGIFWLAGLTVVLTYWFVLRPNSRLTEDDYLAAMMISFLLFFFGICCRFWGWATLRAAAFPLGFLVFMVPLPTLAISRIDSFLQHGSAMAAEGFFRSSGTPFFQDGLAFQLPGITLFIAPECSGIHSSLVLFIASLVAGHVYLRTPWKRAALALFVIPLGLLRNGFRVFVVGELCVHIGPQMINSYIHRKGGPIFFVLSLVPLFLLLMILQRSELTRKTSNPENSKSKYE
jgi:exosortase C (VPDSG-CTERM-specific)